MEKLDNVLAENLLQISDYDLWTKIYNGFQTKGGVYKIISVQNGKRTQINRFLGSDPDGVLYIGKATSFIDRVINLKKSISPEFGGSSHICGRRYKANPNIAQQFPFCNLYLELTQSDTPEELERELLKNYCKLFGEVPPLNAV